MKSEWEIMTLSDLSIKTEYGYTASAKDNKEKNEPRFLRITDIQGGIVNWDTVPYCEIESNKLGKYQLNYGDIVVARTGNSTGENYMFDSEELAVYASYLIRYIINQNIAEPKFIWYQMRSSKWTNFINNVKGGSAQSGANAKTMGAFECFVPPLPTQKKIAHILSTLDDKIELNRKMNQTLEAMASAIFKSWFVDFDPVHAKANCTDEAELENIAKELGISKAILDLFPSEFIESELGMIPKGWKWKSFGDVVVPKRGKTITKSTITEGNIPVVAGGLSPAYYHGEYNAEAPTITISASGANAGYVNLYNENIWASDCSYINNTNTKYVYSMYLFLKEQQYEITRMQQGAAQPHVYPKDLMRLMIVECGEKFWKLLEKTITPIFEKIANNQNEIQTLQKTRDTLLPKLLSGEIDVSELEI